MAKQQSCKATDLGSLQEQVEAAARKLKAAKTAVTNANSAYDRACEAYGIAQKALVAGVEQIQISTKVS